MLNQRAPYPEVGSYALLDEGGETHLVRIQYRTDPGTAKISFPLRSMGASGNRTVQLDQLCNADPLTSEETLELRKLDSAFVRVTTAPPKGTARRDWFRKEELRTRAIRSETAARLMQRLPREQRMAVAA